MTWPMISVVSCDQRNDVMASSDISEMINVIRKDVVNAGYQSICSAAGHWKSNGIFGLEKFSKEYSQ